MYLHSIDMSQQVTLGFINTLGFLIRIEGCGSHNSKMQQEDKDSCLAVEQCTTTLLEEYQGSLHPQVVNADTNMTII